MVKDGQMDPKWLEWARTIQALAQNGLAYSEGPFDRERYEALREIAIEMLAMQADDDVARLRGLFREEKGYATPKVDVRGVVFADGKILLVQERRDMKWTLPGGWVDVFDRPSRAAEREVREESGYEVRATKLLALWDRSLHGHPPSLHAIYKAFFRCELLGGAPRRSIETADVGFFAEDALPELSLPRTTPSEIARMFEHLRHPDWPLDAWDGLRRLMLLELDLFHAAVAGRAGAPQMTLRA